MRKIAFITGTRADFGKLKPLIRAVENQGAFESHLFVTGMHTLQRHGNTIAEIQKENFKNIHVYENQSLDEPMSQVLANTITGFTRYVHQLRPDLIVAHGDRIEALAGAIVGALNNTLVAHIEGGEVSGTVDELIRHSISKLAHIHFVANEQAAKRLRQLGEQDDNIYVIGSPEIDIMLSSNLPTLDAACRRYGITFGRYAIAVFHPVTTEQDTLEEQARSFTQSLIQSSRNFIVILPNNDLGSEIIFREYEKLKGLERIRIFPSIRFEYFLSFLKHADFIIGNSSSGVREAPVYGVPAINIGTRQTNRFKYETILDVSSREDAIFEAMKKVEMIRRGESCLHFGSGNSADLFVSALKRKNIWATPHQKIFYDIPLPD